MKKRVLIIDGYNVIRNNKRYLGLGCDFDGKETWNKAREALINDASVMSADDFNRIVVVFDGAGNSFSDGKPTNKAGVEVIFSPSGTDADSVIEKLALDIRKNGGQALVVSSDYNIQKTVFGGGITRMSASAFASESEENDIERKEHMRNVINKTTIASRLDDKTINQLEALIQNKL